MDRPGLQAALQMIKRGRANTLIVVKLDRLSRSLRDVCTLVEDFFDDERYHLLSVCGMVNTHTAAGRMCYRGQWSAVVETPCTLVFLSGSLMLAKLRA